MPGLSCCCSERGARASGKSVRDWIPTGPEWAVYPREAFADVLDHWELWRPAAKVAQGMATANRSEAPATNTSGLGALTPSTHPDWSVAFCPRRHGMAGGRTSTRPPRRVRKAKSALEKRGTRGNFRVARENCSSARGDCGGAGPA